MVTEVAKLAKDVHIATTALTAVSKNEDKIISHFFLSECMRKHDTLSGNPNQCALNPSQALALN